MKFQKLAVCVASLALPLTALAAPAADASSARGYPYKAPVVKWAGHARTLGDHALVGARYRCFGGNVGTHVWVSLKQGPKITRMSLKQLKKAEGTSAISKSWYDTNKTDPQLVYVVCNGKWQHQTFRLKKEKGHLHRGWAFLQFCLFDSHSDPTSQTSTKGFAFRYSKVWVTRSPV
jgi:hypothetical protein